MDYQHLPSGELQYASDTPPSQQQLAKDPAIHQRTYQACIPCRRRKVRCDLGSVDNPHDPPCVRCRRESKECFFSATRRKKKNGGEGSVGTDGDEETETIYEIKSGKKRVRTTSIVPESGDGTHEDYLDDEDEPRTPGGHLGRLQPLRRPQPQKTVQYGEEEQKASDQTVAILQAAELHSGHDALKVLSAAAQMRDRMGSKEVLERPTFSVVSPASLPPATSPTGRAGASSKSRPMTATGNDPWAAKLDPRVHSASTSEIPEPVNTIAYGSALKAWSRHRFVRAGWFTAKEAIDYISYFYTYLAPLTPVAMPDFRSYDTHEKMLTQEPMLTVTILLIASRHMKLEGPGALSRPYAIHDKLWKYLSGMINRVVWGQEQFGGGFCGAGAEPGSDVNPLTRKGLRTLGTVESMVLLTEWHPRAMHFPPDEDDEELMLPDRSSTTLDLDSADENDSPNKGIGGQRMDAWLEPCWRSDRMCWMLLGMAMSLAFEIGVFDLSDWQRHARSIDGQPLSADELQTYDQRRGSVRDILLVYVTQTSGRLGLTSMLPGNYSKPEDSDLFRRKHHSSISETVLHYWLRMAAIMREGNQKIFANKAFTRDLIKNGNYIAALERLREPLLAWRQDFDAYAAIPIHMRHILSIEYEYCRVYLNALALQAVAERCANVDPMANILDPPIEMARSAIPTNGVRTDAAIDPQTLAKWLGGDRKFLLAVGDGARNLLSTVVDGLYPDGYLRHAPVRTYFRIVSVAIMLLKSFSLGASESDVADSLTLMDRTVEALNTCIVDDVHVASRFAELLNTLTQSLKPRLVRISAEGRINRSRGVSHLGSPAPNLTSVNTTHQRLQTQPVQQAQQQQPQQAMRGAVTNNPQFTYNSYGYNTNVSRAPSSDPLFGISMDTYDPLGNNFSVMPPPNYGIHPPTTNNLASTSAAGNGGYDPYTASNNLASDYPTQDWLTLPLDNLINMTPGAEVNQTMYGPQIGDHDMLEMLLYGDAGQQNGNAYG